MVDLEYEIVNPGTTASIVADGSGMQDRMAFAGVRFGDPSRPRYATGRRDGGAPALKWRGVTTGVAGKQGR